MRDAAGKRALALSSSIARRRSASFTHGNSCGGDGVSAERLAWDGRVGAAYVYTALDQEALEAFYACVYERLEVRLAVVPSS